MPIGSVRAQRARSGDQKATADSQKQSGDSEPVLEEPETSEGDAFAADPAADDADSESSSDDDSELRIEPTDDRVPQPLLTYAHSLTDFEALAFQTNPTLAAAAARIDAAAGQQVQAGLYPNPVIGYTGLQIGLQGTAGLQGGFISQRFITGGKLALDQDIAGKEVDIEHLHLRAQEIRLLSDVRLRFFEALTAQQRAVLSRKLAGIGDELVSATQKLLEAEQGTENDLLQAEIRADESHILLDDAMNDYVAAWRRLVAVVGRPEMPPNPVRGELDANLPQLDWDTTYATVLSGHPALDIARTRVTRAALVLERAKREPIPNVDVSLGLLRQNVTGDDVARIQVSLPVPVFDRNQGNIRSAEANWLAACHDVRRIELQLHEELATAYRRYTNAQHQVARYGDRILPRAKRSLLFVANGYEEGQVEYLTLLTAQTTYFQVSLSYLASLRELRTSASLIEGQLLSNNLQFMQANSASNR